MTGLFNLLEEKHFQKSKFYTKSIDLSLISVLEITELKNGKPNR